jgi:hypothetical protein
VLQQQRTCALRASSAACMRGPQPSLHDEGCDVVQLVKMKGRVACEISTCECLIATEAIFRGLFSDLTPAEAVSLLCSLVNQNKVRLWLPVSSCTDAGSRPCACGITWGQQACSPLRIAAGSFMPPAAMATASCSRAAALCRVVAHS